MQLFIRRHTSVRCISFSTATLAYALKECLQKMIEIKHETAEDLYVVAKSGTPVDFDTYGRLLEECIHIRSLQNGKQVHTHIIKTGFETNMFLGNQLLNMYAKCGNLEDAGQVFDKMSERNLVTWTMLIVAYAQSRRSEDAWKLFCQMQRVGLKPNQAAFISAIKTCAVSASLKQCKQIHASVFHAGFHSDAFVACALVDLYAKCRSIEDARQVFDKMVERDVVSWVAIIAGCTQNQCEGEALNLFCQMQREGSKANYFIVSSLLSACANLLALECGEQVHAYAIKAGFDSEISVGNSLVTMYARCGTLNKAQSLFDKMHRHDVISWNAVISGYAQRGNGIKALQLFAQMHRADMKPNYVTFASVLSASANAESLEEGSQVHADAIKAGYSSDVLVGGAIVDMYAKCGNIQGARLAFDKTSKKNVVLWNVMLVGYGQSGKCEESFELFRQMQWAGMKPNQFTFPSILRTCASLAALEQGEQIHTHIIKTGFDSNVFVGSVLVDVYAKCGSIESARLVLDNMPERDMVSWTAMIAGYAQHEYGKEALQLFEEMQFAGMKQDHITFASALSACASLEALAQGKQLHAHLVKNGFDSDVSVGNTLVTMYAKCGSIGDASKIFNEMSEQICC
jgi:pentatricopeptide repeat protein